MQATSTLVLFNFGKALHKKEELPTSAFHLGKAFLAALNHQCKLQHQLREGRPCRLVRRCRKSLSQCPGKCPSPCLAVRVRLNKSSHVFEGGSCCTTIWDQILSLAGGASPPACDAKTWFCVAGGGGLAHPCFSLCHIQHLLYGKPWFCSAWELCLT